MKKVYIIAVREFLAMIGTKAFLLSIIMMPILMGGSLIAIRLMKNTGEVKERTVSIIDHSGDMLPALRMTAATMNATVGSDSGVEKNTMGIVKDAKYTIEEGDPANVTDESRFELCERIRKGDLFAFVEIPDDVHLLDEDGNQPEVKIYSQETGFSVSQRWIEQAVNKRALAMRLQNEGIDFTKVETAKTPVPFKSLGLLERDGPDGEIKPGVEKNELAEIFLPMGAMLLMFVVTFMAAQPMLEGVLEEKSQRIAEVLLGSANPSQLMAGKLLGTVAGSLTVFSIYAIGAFAICQTQGYSEYIPFQVVPWFIVYQILSVLFYAAIFMAVGSAVSQLKEAQSMLLPVWMLMMVPMFIWMQVIQDPNGSLAVWLSFFPPATASMMVMRLATGATIPVWQLVLGIVVLAISTLCVVYLAGRIFRVGILWQGKTPKLSELARWAWAG